MFNNEHLFESTLHAMNDGYVRLLEAARELRGWETPAEVARGLTAAGYPTSDQIMTNWKSRGISATGILEVCRIIGCRCEYIRSGQMPLKDSVTAVTTELSPLAIKVAKAAQRAGEPYMLLLLQIIAIDAEKTGASTLTEIQKLSEKQSFADRRPPVEPPAPRQGTSQ